MQKNARFVELEISSMSHRNNANSCKTFQHNFPYNRASQHRYKKIESTKIKFKNILMKINMIKKTGVPKKEKWWTWITSAMINCQSNVIALEGGPESYWFLIKLRVAKLVSVSGDWNRLSRHLEQRRLVFNAPPLTRREQWRDLCVPPHPGTSFHVTFDRHWRMRTKTREEKHSRRRPPLVNQYARVCGTTFFFWKSSPAVRRGAGPYFIIRWIENRVQLVW